MFLFLFKKGLSVQFKIEKSFYVEIKQPMRPIRHSLFSPYKVYTFFNKLRQWGFISLFDEKLYMLQLGEVQRILLKIKLLQNIFFDKRNSEGNSHYKVDWLFSQHNVVLLNTTNIICNIWPLSRATYFYCPTFLDKKLSCGKFNQLNEFLSKIKHC